GASFHGRRVPRPISRRAIVVVSATTVAALGALAAVALWRTEGSPGGACREDNSCDPGLSCIFATCWSDAERPTDSYLYTKQYDGDADLIRNLIYDDLRLRPG